MFISRELFRWIRGIPPPNHKTTPTRFWAILAPYGVILHILPILTNLSLAWDLHNVILAWDLLACESSFMCVESPSRQVAPVTIRKKMFQGVLTRLSIYAITNTALLHFRFGCVSPSPCYELVGGLVVADTSPASRQYLQPSQFGNSVNGFWEASPSLFVRGCH